MDVRVGVANFFCFGQNKMLNGKDYDLLRKPDLSEDDVALK